VDIYPSLLEDCWEIKCGCCGYTQTKH